MSKLSNYSAVAAALLVSTVMYSQASIAKTVYVSPTGILKKFNNQELTVQTKVNNDKILPTQATVDLNADSKFILQIDTAVAANAGKGPDCRPVSSI